MKSSDYSELFVSYRRKNVEFVKELVDALREQGKEVWIDWEDIPPGSVGFADDIKRGLEGADAFLCVLSPDYLESTYCMDLELGYALELGKKIIPVVYQRFDRERLPEKVQHINWIYFVPHAGEENEFEDGLSKIITAIDTDYEHAREHKRLALRALEWQENERQKGYLLNGEELDVAETWISTAGDKNPTPTTLHSEYILVSRALYLKRQRQLIASITIGLIVTFVLAVLSFVLYREAEAQRVIAARQADEAQSVALANAAQVATFRDDLPDRALLLALESLNIENPPLAAQRVLPEVLHSPGTRSLFTHHTDLVRSVSAHPDGEIAASASNDRVAVVWNIESGEVIREIDVHTDWTTVVAFSPSGDRLLTGSADGSFIVWEVATWEPLYTVQAHVLGVDDADWSADGSQILTAGCVARDTAAQCEDSDISLWDATTGDEIITFELFHEDAVTSIDLSADGERAISGGMDGQMILWDVAEGVALSFYESEDEVRDVAFLPGEAEAVAGSADKFVRRWDLASNEMLRLYAGPGGRVLGLAVSDDGETIVAASEDSGVYLWDTASGALMYTYREHTREVQDVTFTPERSTILSASQDNSVRLIDMESSMNLRTLRGLDGRIVLSLGITSDESIVVAGDLDSVVAAWDATDGDRLLYEVEVDSRLPDQPDPAVTSLAMGADDALFYVAMSTGEIIEMETATGEEVRRWVGHDANFIRAIRALPDGERLLTCGHDNTLMLWDIEDAELLLTMEGHANWVLNCVVDNDGTHALSAGADFNVGYWDLVTGEMVYMMEGHTDFVWGVDFNADGTEALSSSRDQTLIRWDLTNMGLQSAAYAGGHASAITNVRYAPQAPYAVSAGRDFNIVMWNLETGAIAQVYRGHGEAVWEIEFNAEGDTMYSTASDMTVRTWALTYDVEDWRAYADTARYVRPATDAERTLYGLGAGTGE